MSEKIRVTVQDVTSGATYVEDWTCEDRDKDESVEMYCKKVVNAFNETERQRYGDDAKLRAFVSAEVLEEDDDPEDDWDEEDDEDEEYDWEEYDSSCSSLEEWDDDD